MSPVDAITSLEKNLILQNVSDGIFLREIQNILFIPEARQDT